MAEDSGLFRKLIRSIWPKKSSPGGEKWKSPLPERKPGRYDCPEVRGLASDYLEGDLQSGVSGAIRRHLDGCEACTAFINTLRKTIDMMRGLPLTKAPDRLRSKIIDTVSRGRP